MHRIDSLTFAGVLCIFTLQEVKRMPFQPPGKVGRVSLAVALALGAGLSASAIAADPVIAVQAPSCSARGANIPVSLRVTPTGAWSSVRAYFRVEGAADLYFLEMRSNGNGSFWAVLPRPEVSVASVEVIAAVRDADGREFRAEPRRIAVAPTCQTQLSADERRYAANLVVGETAPSQAGAPLRGFTCDGLLARMRVDGTFANDSFCRSTNLVASGIPRQEAIQPLALVGGAAGDGETTGPRQPRPVIRPIDPKPASPSPPR